MSESTTQPTVEWEYRNFPCRVYQLGELKTLGFTRVGDEWTQVVEEDDVDANVKQQVERKVDSIIADALGDESGLPTIPLDGPDDPIPDIDPNPDPYPQPDPKPRDDPWPPRPVWRVFTDYISNTVPIRQHGFVEVETTSGGMTRVSVSELGPDTVTDDGLYKG